jgi:hypothetical protein
MTHTLFTPVHVHHSYVSYGQFSYVATFYADPIELDRFTTPEKKMLLISPLSPIECPTGLDSVFLLTQ